MLPADKSAWPPEGQTLRYDRMAINSTWYGGDPNKLSQLYGGNVRTAGPSQKNILSRVYDWFWGQADPNQLDDKVHLPVAQDIAQMSSELLFAETPRFVVQPVEFDEEGNVSDAHRAEVDATQERLTDILDGCQFDALLLAAAETCAALGSAGLRIGYDTKTMSMPVITRVDGDGIVPEYAFGQLSAVTFWRYVKIDGETLWVHLERHTPGQIEHGLYKGIKGNLGERQPLGSLPEMVSFDEITDDEGVVKTVDKQMSAVSVPNALPDPTDRLNYAGRSDFSPGVLTLFDAIDKAITSLMRDIEDGRSRLLIADYMLESSKPGEGVSFDTHQHMFTRLKMSPSEAGDPPIAQVQFKIRVEEHLNTLDFLTKKVVESCGYNVDADNGDGGGDMTATEYQGRNKKSLATRAKKLRYWQAVEPLLQAVLAIDAEFFKSGVRVLPVKMEVAAATQTSPKMLAETVEIISRAKVASLEVMVRMLHPDWDDPSVDAEVALIMEQQSLASPDMLPGDAGAPGEPLQPIEIASSV